MVKNNISPSNIEIFASNPLIFLDTSFLIAFFNKKDKNFNFARNVIQETLNINQNVKFILSDYIFDELITLLKSKKIIASTIEKIGDKIISSNIFRILYGNEEIFKETWDLCKKYQDKLWSFTDTNSFCLMGKYNIKYYLSFDKHFSQYPKILEWDTKLF